MLDKRRQIGVDWRHQVPVAAQSAWQSPANRRDPVEILIEQGKTRIPELLPVRYARMKTDPFAFLRGAAAIMAGDLASASATGSRVQSCGDCHLANFGAYATPGGTPIFDINDFDETLPAPFEWDVKRLATSLAVAGRAAEMPESDCRRLARRLLSIIAGTWRVWRACRRSTPGARASSLPMLSPTSTPARSGARWKNASPPF
jgi:hypothetical protein